MNTSTDDQFNWPRLRNAIRKRLKRHWTANQLPWQDFADAVADAVAFAFLSITERGTAPGLAIVRAVGRVKRGQTPFFEPKRRASWEQEPDWTRSPNGVGAATRRAARGLPIAGRTKLD